MVNEENLKEETFEIRDLREKDKFEIDDEFLDKYAKILGIYAVGVYASLCKHADRKKRANLSIKKIAEELNICRNKVIEAIKYLEFWKIIKKERVGLRLTNRYYLLKKTDWKQINESNLKEFSEVYSINFKKFTTRTSRSLRHKLQENINKTNNNLVSNSLVSCNNTSNNSLASDINNININNYPAGKEINKLITYWKEINPSYEKFYKIKAQREAVARMVQKLGKEKYIKLVKSLQISNQKPYFPIITTPLELEKNLARLIACWQREKQRSNKIIEI